MARLVDDEVVPRNVPPSSGTQLNRYLHALEKQIRRWVELLDQARDVAAARFQAIDGRLDNLEAAQHRVDIVPAVPASAPPGYLLMTPGDPNLYIGTGTGLRKVLTTIVQ